MHDSLLVAAPLMIAAVVMAFRFVGCGIDSDPLPGYGDGDGNDDGGNDGTKPKTYQGDLTGNGTLTAKTGFPGHDPATKEYDSAGTYAFAIPFWCTTIDLILLGAGGGGTYFGDQFGVGGGAGQWQQPAPLQRGSDIPWAATTINVTVGQGGSGGTPSAPATPGGDTTASWDTATGTTQEVASGGGAGASANGQSGDGPSPTSKSVDDATLSAGPAQSALAAAGNPPGGGGSGGDVISPGGAGADGAAIIGASQS
jgi:hypothetical protein